MKFEISWHKNGASNHYISTIRDINHVKSEIGNLYRSIADYSFKQLQIAQAIKDKKEAFDEEKYMKNARQEFMEKAKQRLTAAVSAFEEACMQSYQTPHGTA